MHTETIYPEGPISKPLSRQDAKRPHGLVLYSTSATHEQRFFEARASRLKRMKRTVITSARIHAEHVSAKGFRKPKAAMLTLTYRPDSDYSPRHVSDLLERVRKWLKRRGVHQLRYVWVLELTKAGKPHYHLVFFLPRGLTLPKPDKQGWWPHGSTRIEWARNAVGYLAKYASKGGDGWQLPAGARLYGAGGFTDDQREERAYILAPGWIRAVWDNKDYKVRRAIGGGWISLATGVWMASPFIVQFDGKRRGVTVTPMDVKTFVSVAHDTWREDIGLRDFVRECLEAGGKVVQLGQKQVCGSLRSPMAGDDPDTPEYWKKLGRLYCQAIDAMGRDDLRFHESQLDREWAAFFSASQVRIMYIMSN